MDVSIVGLRQSSAGQWQAQSRTREADVPFHIPIWLLRRAHGSAECFCVHGRSGRPQEEQLVLSRYSLIRSQASRSAMRHRQLMLV